MYFLAVWPSSVPPETFARKMSPVEIFGIAEVRRDELGLGALARSGRPDEDESHYAANPSSLRRRQRRNPS